MARFRSHLAFAGCVLLLLAAVVSPARAQSDLFLYAPGNIGTSAFTTNAGSTPTSITTIGAGASRQGFGSVVRGDQAFAYVGYNGSSPSIQVINTATQSVVQTVAAAGRPQFMVSSPNGSTLYVANDPGNNVLVYSVGATTGLLTQTSTITIDAPRGLAISPDGATLYVANRISNSVSVVNTATNTITATVGVGTEPFSIAINPAGTLVYVGDIAGASVSVINTATNTVATTFSNGGTPAGIVLSPDGRYLYVTATNLNQVRVYDTSSNALIGTFASASSPIGLAISPDGSTLYVMNGGSNNGQAFSINASSGLLTSLGFFSTTPGAALFGLCGNGSSANGMLGSGGTFFATSTGALGCAGSSATMTGGTIVAGVNNLVMATPIVLASQGGTVDTNGNNLTLGGAISGPGGLTKTGVGTLTLSGSSTYSGATNVNVGTLQAGATNAFSPFSAFTVASGAVLDLNNFNQTIGSLAGAGSVTLGSATLTTGNDNTSTTFSGGISGTGGLTKIGTGTFTLAGSSAYTGATNLNAGTLQAGAINAFASSSAFTVASGATLDLNNFNQTIGSLAGAGKVTLGSATLTTNGNDMSTVYSGVISGTGGLVKTGSAILTLLGANTYTGGTTVADGALEIGDATHTAAIAGAVINNGVLLFMNADTSAITTITNNNTAAFLNSTSAGNAIITNSAFLNFGDASSAGNARITNNGNLGFGDTATAANAVIVNNAVMGFAGASTAGNATIITNNGGLTGFAENSSGGSARLITNAGGAVDISPLTKTGVAVGSIEGAGSYFLGSKQLTVGGNNLSTEVSGAIKDGGFLGGTGGSLVKTGTGTLLLSGVSSYTGATTVNGGTLIVNGSIASSPVTVANGAMLAGTGTVGATTIMGGATFAPGNSPGTMTVNGNLAFQSGAIYLVQVNPSTASSANVTAGGSASLAGTVQAAFASGSYLTRNYTIVSAAGGISGAFGGLSTSNLPAGFTANLTYTANNAILNLTATLGQPPTPPAPTAPTGPTGPSALGATALSGNQLNVANSLNGFFNNGGALPPAFVSIFGLTGGNLGNALSLLSGEAATGAQQVGFQLTNQFLGLMLDPFVDGRGAVGGADHPALGFAPENETTPPQIALAYASVSKAPPKPAPAVYEPRWTVWGAGFGGSNRTSGDIAVTGSHDLAASTAGFAGGFDYHLSRDSVVGLAFAGGGTNWSVSQGLGGGKSDAFQAGLYGATKYGPAYLAAAFAFAEHWMSTDRLAFGGDHLTASFNAQSYGGRLEGGYRFATIYAGVTPYAAVQAQNFHTPGYSEGGVIANGFALGFNGRDATDTRSELGARFDRALAVYTNAVLALRARVAWAHDWVSDPSLTPLFQTLPGASFVVNGATPAKDSVLTTAGAEYRLASGVTLLAKFDGEFASHSSTYAGTGTLRYAW